MSDCDRRCIERQGRWCDQCWAKVLKGGWEHQAGDQDEPEDHETT